MADLRNSEESKVEKQDLIRCPHCGKSFRIYEGAQAQTTSSGMGGRFAAWAFAVVLIAAVVWLIMPKPEEEHDHSQDNAMASTAAPPIAPDAELPEGHPPIDGTTPGAGGDPAASAGGAMPQDLMQRLDALKARVEANPKDSEALKELGNMYYDIAKADEAIEYYSKYLEVVPDDAFVLNDIGRMYIAAGKTSEAVSSLERSIKLDPNLPQPLVNLGLAYAGVGEFEKSIEALNKAISLSTDQALTDSAKALLEQVKQAMSDESAGTTAGG